MPELKLLFLQMAVILVTARLMAAALARLHQPEVIGEMVAGILLGPSLLGRVSPGILHALFPPGGMGPLYALSQVGLVLFMFLVGHEVRLGDIRHSARAVILTSQASIAVPFLGGGILAWQLYPTLGTAASRLSFVLFLGAAMSITAFPVLARILADRQLTHTRIGVFAISCAAVDDVSAWCMLAVITAIASPHASSFPLPIRFAGLGVYVSAMLLLVRPLLRLLVSAGELRSLGWFAAGMIFLLLSAFTTEALGVHALFGAFLAGIVMPRGKLELEFRGHLEYLTRGLLLPLFFAYTGLRTSIPMLNDGGAWWLCGLLFAVAVASKLLVSAICVRWSGWPWRDSLAVGILVNTRGLVELVILNVGLDLHILSPRLFSIMVIVALGTTLMTSPLIDWVWPRERRV